MSNQYQWVVYQTTVNTQDSSNSVAFFNVLHQDSAKPAHVSGSCNVDLTNDDLSQDQLVSLVKKTLGATSVVAYERKLTDQIKG